jgi:hypothetical protein
MKGKTSLDSRYVKLLTVIHLQFKLELIWTDK